MLTILQLLVIVFAALFLIYVARLVAQTRLLLKYSLLWILLAFVAVLSALFPEPLYGLARCLGFENPSNFIFFLGLFLLMIISLSLSVIVSRQRITIKNLVQEQALLAKRSEEWRLDFEKRYNNNQADTHKASIGSTKEREATKPHLP